MGNLGGVVVFVNKPENMAGICRSTVASWQPVPVNQLQSVRCFKMFLPGFTKSKMLVDFRTSFNVNVLFGHPEVTGIRKF